MGPSSDLHEQFHRLVDEHYDAVRSYARFLTGRADAAEDLVHEAFLRVHGRLATGPLEGDAGKYLRGIVRHLVCDWWHAERRLPQDLADRLKVVAEEADSEVDSESLRAALQACIERLSDEARGLLAKRYAQGLRVVRIAEELRVNAATIRTRLLRIRQALKRCIEGRLSPGGGS